MSRLPVLAAVLLLAPAALASHGINHFSASGVILAGNPTSADIGSVSENAWALTGSTGLDGLDGFAVTLPAWAPGHTIWTNGTSDAGVHDLDIWFYDADRQFTRVSCATSAADETCAVPPGAAFVYVDLWLGANVHVTVEVQG